MEKFIVEIPERFKERRFTVTAGSEVYMIREPDGSVYRKTIRCNLCGKCCENPGLNWHLGVMDIDGKKYCAQIKKVNNEFFCEGGFKIPAVCNMELPKKAPCHPECIMEYAKI
jgi:hypothetical protein